MPQHSRESEHPGATQDYSTLEVQPAQFSHDDTNKVVTWPTRVFDPASLPEPITPWSPKAYESTLVPTIEEKPRVPRICGLRRRTCLIVSAVAGLVIICAIVGGVVGGVINNRRTEASGASAADGSPSSLPSDGKDRHVHPDSKIAASVLIDGSDNFLRTVFFQDPSNALIARAWDSRTQRWQTTNITDSMAHTTTAVSLPPGTPLASISIFSPNAPANENRRITQVWYLAYSDGPTNIAGARMQSVFQTDTSNNVWTFDEILYGAEVRAMVGSSLAAAWNRSADNNGSGSSALTYQGRDGIIYTAPGGTWLSEAVPGIANAASKSPLALLHTLRDANGLVDDLTIGYKDGNKLVTERLPNADRQEVYQDSLSTSSARPLQYIFGPSRDPKLVTSLVLLPDGTVKGVWKNPPLDIKFSGGPAAAKFSALGTTEDFMLYGITNDVVLEYRLDEKDPAQFNFQGQVYP